MIYKLGYTQHIETNYSAVNNWQVSRSLEQTALWRVECTAEPGSLAFSSKPSFSTLTSPPLAYSSLLTCYPPIACGFLFHTKLPNCPLFSLVYLVSSRTAKAAYRNLSQRNKISFMASMIFSR